MSIINLIEEDRFIFIICIISGVILFFIIILGVLDKAFSVFFILIGSVITTAYNNYILKRKEERNQLNIQKTNLKKLNDIFQYNGGVSKANIQRIEKEPDANLPFLNVGIMDFIHDHQLIFNDEDEETRIMKISLVTDYCQNQIKKRDDFINYFLIRGVDISQDKRLEKINQLTKKNLNQLIELVEDYSAFKNN